MMNLWAFDSAQCPDRGPGLNHHGIPTCTYCRVATKPGPSQEAVTPKHRPSTKIPNVYWADYIACVKYGMTDQDAQTIVALKNGLHPAKDDNDKVASPWTLVQLARLRFWREWMFQSPTEYDTTFDEPLGLAPEMPPEAPGSTESPVIPKVVAVDPNAP